MPLFKIFGLTAAALFVTAALLARNKKFKYHRHFAYGAILFMLLHIAGALGFY